VSRVRNIAIVLALAAIVAFLPGGGSGAQVLGSILSTLILVSFVLLAARFYRERRMDIDGLGERWKLILYGALAMLVLAFAAAGRLFETGFGTIIWLALVAGSVYLLVLVWRHYREYA
jgi:hypothetical protein